MTTKIPIFKDDLSFEDRQRKVWDEMEEDMERRRREWEDEIEHMRKDFFSLKPERDGKFETLSDKLSLSENLDDARGVIEKDSNGLPVFRARFNVREYKPEEVNVKMDTNKVIVGAKHEEKGQKSSVTREYNREVNIPREVDPMTLQCTLSTDGVLTVEAPLPVPQYKTSKTEQGGPHRVTQKVASNLATSSAIPRAGPTPVSPPPSYQPPSFSGSQMSQSDSSPLGSSFGIGVGMAPNLMESSTASLNSSSSSGSGSLERDKKFKVEIDIEGFRPDELTVKTVDKKLVIKARREEKIGNRSSTKELNREFQLPDTVDPVSVKAYFSESGKLFIEAPYFKPIPVSHYKEAQDTGSSMTGR